MVSFVVVSWQAESWLRRFTLGEREGMPHTYSLQALPECEVILVDNASTDSSRELCRSLAESYQKFRALLLPKNAGYARALNLGIQRAKGDIIACCNPDLEIMAPDLLDWLERGLARVPKSLLGPELVFGRGKGPGGGNILYLQGHFVAFRKEFLTDVGYWHEGFGAGGYEDVELSLRAQKYGYHLQEDRGIPIHHHVARSTVYGDNPDFDQAEFDALQRRNKELLYALIKDGLKRYEPV